MKKVLAIAITAALVAPVAAMADATIYGKVRQGIDYVDIDFDQSNGNPNDYDDDVDEIQINDKTSRLGVKGSEDLGDGLKAVYKIEYGVNISGPGNGGDLNARNAYVGLAGDSWGTLLVGRHDTPLKMSTGRLDYFSDTSADNNGGQIDNNFGGYTENLTDRRADGTIAYISPSFSGFTIAGATVPGEVSDNGTNEANGIADGYSVAGMYSNAGLYVSAAYEAIDGDWMNERVSPADDDLSQWRVGAGWDAGNWKISGVYENEQIDARGPGDDIKDADKWVIAGAIKFGNGMAKAKYFDYSDDGTLNTNPANDNYLDHNGFAIGYDYNFSKRTQLSALYVMSTFDDQPNGADDVDVSVFGVQMNHSF
jgi:predicted porin